MKTKTLVLSASEERRIDKPEFSVRSIEVDNLTNLWLIIQAGGAVYYAPPQTVNYVRAVSSDAVDLHLFNAPGLPQGTALTVSVCTVTLSDTPAIPSGGISVTPSESLPAIFPVIVSSIVAAFTITTSPATPTNVLRLHWFYITSDNPFPTSSKVKVTTGSPDIERFGYFVTQSPLSGGATIRGFFPFSPPIRGNPGDDLKIVVTGAGSPQEKIVSYAIEEIALST